MLDTINYEPCFIANPTAVFEKLWNGLAWERRPNTPRREYYCNDIDAAYSYGIREGFRTYLPSPWTPGLRAIKEKVEARFGYPMEVCFVNGYEDSRDSLGWHSDDSAEMDDRRSIGIVTFGAERDIYFAPISDKSDVTRLKLASGSLCEMKPGMQDTHAHKIPRAGFVCGPRISLTFRGYLKP